MADNVNVLDAAGLSVPVSSVDIGSGVEVQRVIPALYSGSGVVFDNQRGNTEGTLLASAARTSGVVSAVQTNYNARGIIIYLNVTAASGTGGLQVFIQGQDPASASVISLNGTPTAITAISFNAYEVFPGSSGNSASFGKTVFRNSGALPRSWFAQVVAGDASSYTYSVGYALIV